MNSTNILITIALAVQGWTLLEVIGIKMRFAEFNIRIRTLEKDFAALPCHNNQHPCKI